MPGKWVELCKAVISEEPAFCFLCVYDLQVQFFARTRVAVAQLVARRSHNPKVVSPILTCHIRDLLRGDDQDWCTPGGGRTRDRALMKRTPYQLSREAH